jgi:hypothetical protein
MPRKPINPNTINWNTVETTLDSGKTNFKTLGKLTGVSASTIRRLMLSRYGTKITLKRGRAVGGIVWTPTTATAPTPTTTEDTSTVASTTETNS